FVTRVGEGPLEGELPREEVERRGWVEYGTVTGRGRRAAPFDFNLARKAVMLNGATQIGITKLDVVFPECKGAREMYALSSAALRFVEKIESETKLPVTIIGTGPAAEDTIDRRQSP
ncbi:MAG: adenylosuccinate synthetase, partial [archaeon]